MTRRPTLVVVGAGPAGMYAALAAATRGVPTLLVDTAPAVGGQYYRQPAAEFRAARPAALGHGWPTYAGLLAALRRQRRVRILRHTTVWAIAPSDAGWRLQLRTGAADAPGTTHVVDATALVIATGAHDRALPFPGWDLPGVYTAGAAQAMATGQRLAIGRHVLVTGTGPFLLPVAGSLLALGARVGGVYEANLPAAWAGAPAVLWRQRRKAAELAGHVATLARHRVGYHARAAVIAAHGDGRVVAATIARLDAAWRPIPGSERRVATDAICVGYGFTPRLELAVAAGCRLRGGGVSPRLAARDMSGAGDVWAPVAPAGADDQPYVAVDDWQRTSVPGVYAAGEVTGVGGADLAAAEGALAGLAIAARHGTAPDDAVVAAVRARVRAGRAFAALLAAAHPVRPGWQTWSDEHTVICRCEEVTRGALATALAAHPWLGAGLAAGVDSTRTLKLLTRVGLGACQGRVCGRNAVELTAGLAATAPPRGADSPSDEATAGPSVAGMSRRPITAPISLGELAMDPAPITSAPVTLAPVTLEDGE